MTKFKKKPTIIEAIQYTGDNIDEISQVLGVLSVINYGESFLIHTLEGNMKVNPGDWVIKGIKGEFYPIKNEIFKLTYEKVKEGVYFQPD